MKKYLLLTNKSWYDNFYQRLQNRPNEEWVRIEDNQHFTLENLQSINPTKIFIPHWSHIIDQSIFEKYECIVFHMTDLPFGRGGSPLQNLIVRGLKETKISALKVENGIDTGAIYLKESLSLEGTASEIFERAVPVIEKMIDTIIEQQIQPQPQTGEVVTFKRRKPEDGNIDRLAELEQIYDHIRMLDCEGYPNAFLETEHFKVDFSQARFDQKQNFIDAHVRIYKK